MIKICLSSAWRKRCVYSRCIYILATEKSRSVFGRRAEEHAGVQFLNGAISWYIGIYYQLLFAVIYCFPLPIPSFASYSTIFVTLIASSISYISRLASMSFLTASALSIGRFPCAFGFLIACTDPAKIWEYPS